ncbi:acetoacetyl-CoA reductase [Caballeronia temeraria]|uniref:Acetoacetyl-CoA reductase n=1 Tax=Caballeronia temeraria TaxID=1777137 RepID=A0A158DRI7_9BURK|nr:SDR family NAD(P)-dependent oxidoreductase [Caballeronia temeraria]SAK96796.1 acetoacetyl-CoA reductase [Caballeronia temeraria]
MRHDKRVVLVTGGSGGIGEAIVERYARDGAAVGIVDVNEEAGAALAGRLADAGLRAHFAAADVGDFPACETACRAIEAALGPVDTLINNAGISPKHAGKPMPLWQMAPEEWRRVMDVNVNSVFNFCRILTPGMVERRFGRIVSMSSVAGKAYLDIVAAHYSTTKAALIGMTRHLAGELGPHGITVNAIAPGRIDTPLVRGVAREANEKVARETPLRRLGAPDEVASTCLFLTSGDAAFVTGQVIDVAGGWLMT